MTQAITAITAALGRPPVPTTTDPAVGNASASGTALAGGFAASRFATKQGSDPATCNLYSITTNQAAIAAPFRVVNRYVGNLAPMPGVFLDYPAPVIRTDDAIGHAAATADVGDRRSTCAQHAIEAIEKGLDATKEDYQIE